MENIRITICYIVIIIFLLFIWAFIQQYGIVGKWLETNCLINFNKEVVKETNTESCK